MDIFIIPIREIKMISDKRSTILAITLPITLLSVALLTTGCIQKKELFIEDTSQPRHQQQVSVGAKTIPYTEPIQQTIRYTQPSPSPSVQQYTQPIQRYTQRTQQPIIQYRQPSAIETSTQYVQESSTPIYEEIECTDETPLNGSNNCDRGSIDKSQLSTQYSHDSSGGNMHSLKSIQGQSIQVGERSNGFTFPSHPGKVIILEMFGQNCPHCIKEIPTLKRIKKRYGNRVEVIAIHSQGVLSPSAGRRFISKHRVNYPVTDGSRATELQYFIQNTYGWTGVLPFTMVIKDGQTEGSFGGEVSYRELREVMDPLF
jgi:thiol-disulfide isomerase/thioredoxin